MYQTIARVDPEIHEAIQQELRRQRDTLVLIASENLASRAVMEASGCLMTNKYAEGYPGRRYYGGCEFVDVAENLARDRARALFGAEHANVQPHSGTQANMAVYFSVLTASDTILSMNLDHGGHLSHGHKLNFAGRIYTIVPYGVREDDGRIDYEALEALAQEHHPKLIVAGASAYSRIIDFERIGAIARACGALFMADIAHIAGLVVAGEHPSPVPHADFVTTTTHKTLRGPRGGLILCRESHAKALDRAVMPGVQGGPLMHHIAAKAVAFHEAMSPGFKAYQRRIVENAKALAEAVAGAGYPIVSGGTDNHMFLVDLRPAGITGKVAEKALERAGIALNKNLIPFDPEKPLVTSGIRIGTPYITSRGMGPEEMVRIAALIARVLNKPEDEAVQAGVREEVRSLLDGFPMPEIYP